MYVPDLGCWGWGPPSVAHPTACLWLQRPRGEEWPMVWGSPLFPAPASVTAVKLPDGVTFIIYEFWETEEDWKR